MSDETPDIPEDDNPLIRAAEYSLGLLDGRNARAFEAEMRDNPDLRDEVVFWTEYFVQFEKGAREVTPRPDVLRAVNRRLFGRKKTILQQIIPYFTGALAAAALAWGVVSLGVLDQFAEPGLRADLAPVEGTLELAAVYNVRAGELHVVQNAGNLPPDRVAEMWLIVGDDAPVSLGLLDPDGDTRVAVPAELASLLPGATLAISDEPPGGSPTGAPTGAVRAAGTLSVES